MIPKIAITGGPCAGKTTAIFYLRDTLRDFGVTPVVVPEVATHVFTSGISHNEMVADAERYDAFQTMMLQAVVQIEDRWARMAELLPGERKVLLCDRGTMDVGAYHEDFDRLLKRQGLTRWELREHRYVAVFHLVTVAKDAPELYTRINNQARRETVDEACASDDRTASQWAGHPYLRIMHNTETLPDGSRRVIAMETKMERLRTGVLKALGVLA